MKIGLFGGSFNPIHKAHIKLIKEILKNKIVDEVWVMPCYKHAFDKHLADSRHRVGMLNIAIKKIKKAKICRIEIESGGHNYTIDTIKKLRRIYRYEFFFIFGSDVFYEIKRWRKSKELLKKTKFIVVKRKGYKIKKVPGMKAVFLMKNPIPRISSTEIRERLKQGLSIKHLVPEEVERYIKKNKLYK